MADSAWVSSLAAAAPGGKRIPRHSAVVRITHWITAFCFFALLFSGVQLVISHPRFYWGEVGNVNTPALFQLPIPASREAVKTGYNFVLPDQNGWSRYLHFQAAWAVMATAIWYAIHGLLSRHFRLNILPEWSWAELLRSLREHARFQKPAPSEALSYNILQRVAYSSVVFLLFPLMIWTGLAMSPGFVSAFPLSVELLGGHQSARTLHFFAALLLILFVLGHVAMVIHAGFANRMRAMTTGRVKEETR